MKTKNKTVVLEKGKTFIDVLVGLHELDDPGDPWEGKASVHEKWYSVDFVLKMGGITAVGREHSYYTDESRIRRIPGMTAEVKACIEFWNKKELIRIGLTEKNAKAVADAVDSLKNDLATPEVRAFFEAKENAKKNAERKKCEAVISACEDIIRTKGRLMTAKEAKAWLRNYNNVVNEGGEGFLPKIWTVEEYESAKKKLFGIGEKSEQKAETGRSVKAEQDEWER